MSISNIVNNFSRNLGNGQKMGEALLDAINHAIKTGDTSIISVLFDKVNVKKDSNALNTKKMYKNIQLKDNLKDGLFLLEMSPKKILNLIGQEENLLGISDVDNLLSSINLDKNKLSLEGLLAYNVKTKMPVKDINYNLIDIERESDLPEDFILIDNPKQYFRKDSVHPYQKFIASLIKESTSSDYSELFKIILENSQGNLIWINDKDWLVLTKKSDTSKTAINAILKKENFLNSNLDFRSRKLEIWSKISTNENKITKS